MRDSANGDPFVVFAVQLVGTMGSFAFLKSDYNESPIVALPVRANEVTLPGEAGAEVRLRTVNRPDIHPVIPT